MSPCPDKELLLHALADGELDAGNGLALEAHLATCAACAAELAAIREVQSRLRAAPLGSAAPQGLHERLEAAIEAETAPPPRRRTGASLQSELIDAQARSLEAQHLVDVQTSDRHTVKPWFNGKVDFAPPVADLGPQGYPLVGGRLDRIDGRRVAALVFRRRAHVINLFVWPGDAPAAPALTREEGYSLVRWGRGGPVFWAVSDIDAGDLMGFQAAFAAATG
jgi:anti-sigma factor RsiW